MTGLDCQWTSTKLPNSPATQLIAEAGNEIHPESERNRPDTPIESRRGEQVPETVPPHPSLSSPHSNLNSGKEGSARPTIPLEDVDFDLWENSWEHHYSKDPRWKEIWDQIYDAQASWPAGYRLERSKLFVHHKLCIPLSLQLKVIHDYHQFLSHASNKKVWTYI